MAGAGGHGLQQRERGFEQEQKRDRHREAHREIADRDAAPGRW